ncbi:MAG: DUF309 domain-containing protein, partial [Streptosporangiaceae bacterium]
ARNARPRDGLGRPLERGDAGEPTLPDGVVLAPAGALDTAQQLLDAGRPFHAHEVLEASWKAAPEAERDLWQGLAQLAVGLTHARRGNAAGAAALLRRGAARVSRYGTAGRSNPDPHSTDPVSTVPRSTVPHSTDPVSTHPRSTVPDSTDRHGVDADGLVAAATGLADRIEAAGLDGLAQDQLSLRLRAR